MSPKPADPAVRDALVEAAARVLATEGEAAVTARRMAKEVSASTMAVYTHFGGMDELVAQVWRRGYLLFGEELERPAHTADVVADWFAQGWGYRHFAQTQPHLYSVMFGTGLPSFHINPDDSAVATATFVALIERVQRCVDAGRWATVDDVVLAAEVIWATVHGLVTIEQSGYFSFTGRDAEAAYEDALIRLSTGFGDDASAARRSAKTGRRRAPRTST